MGRLLFVLPSVGAGDTVRIDTASGSNTPASIAPASGGPAITGAVLHAGADGALPRVLGPADGTATLYLKQLDYRGAVTGSPTTLTGSDLDAAPDANAASAAPPVRIKVIVIGNAGRAEGYVDLLPDDDGQRNCLSGVIPLSSYSPGNIVGGIAVEVPDFDGTLGIAFAECNVYNPDWTQVISLGVDTPIPLTSGQGYLDIPFDDTAEETGRHGTDLSASAGDLGAITAAGGVFTGSWVIKFATAGLTAPNP